VFDSRVAYSNTQINLLDENAPDSRVFEVYFRLSRPELRECYRTLGGVEILSIRDSELTCAVELNPLLKLKFFCLWQPWLMVMPHIPYVSPIRSLNRWRERCTEYALKPFKQSSMEMSTPIATDFKAICTLHKRVQEGVSGMDARFT
jgi:hypothetical protein